MTRALEVKGLTARRGGIRALDSVDVEVGEWEIVGLVGPDGAGKTTLLDTVTGVVRPARGTVHLRGIDVTGLPPHRRTAMGLARTWEDHGAVPTLTLMENLLTAQHGHIRYSSIGGMVGSPWTFFEERELRHDAEEILEFLELWDLRNRPAGRLSLALRRRLDVALALATDPTLLLLDEASTGLGPEETRELGRTLSVLRSELGLTVLLAEHDARMALEVCDYVYVLNSGRVLAKGPPEAIREEAQVAAAYLGEEASEKEDGASA